MLLFMHIRHIHIFQQGMADEYKNIEVIVEIRTGSPVNKKICKFSKYYGFNGK